MSPPDTAGKQMVEPAMSVTVEQWNEGFFVFFKASLKMNTKFPQDFQNLSAVASPCSQ